MAGILCKRGVWRWQQLGTFYRRGQLQECCKWKSADMDRVTTSIILESGILLRLNYSDRRM